MSSVHVDNVAPTASLGNGGPVDEGSPATITFSGASDPSSADTSAGFRYTFDCDGTNDLAASYAAADAPDNTTCTFNDNGSFTVFGRIFDKDDGYTQYSTVVTVDNVAPQNVEGGNDQTVNEGDLVSLSGSFTDPGSADTHTFVWHVVAGNGQTITNGAGQNFSFTPNDNGSYTVTFTVTDNDAGSTATTSPSPSTTWHRPPPCNGGPVTRAVPPSPSAVPPIRRARTPAPASATPSTARHQRPGGHLPRPTDRRHAARQRQRQLDRLRPILDKDDGYTEYYAVVTVNNVAPQNVKGGNDQTVDEGDLVSLSGSFTDPAAPTPTPSCGTWSPVTARPSPTAPARTSASRPTTTAATR